MINETQTMLNNESFLLQGLLKANVLLVMHINIYLDFREAVLKKFTGDVIFIFCFYLIPSSFR